MKTNIFILFLMLTSVLFSQEEDKKLLEQEAKTHLREGNKLYNNLQFSEAEVAYKKALEKNPNYSKAYYNLGNAVQQQNRNKEAIASYEVVAKTATEKLEKASIYHNIGNAFMNEKEYGKAVESFKNALRNNPKDDETRYNLALAQKQLEDQQQENKDDKNKDNKDQNKDQNKEKENQDKKDDQKGEDEDKKDKGGDENEDQKNDQNQKKKDQQPKPNQLSPQQVKQLLEAMNNEENKTQQKMNAKKAKGQKIKQEKDW